MIERPAVNPFAAPGVARRYLVGRPASHEGALERARALLGVEAFGHGLDVACGPGPSTTALAGKAAFAVGVDVVEEMVRTAASVGNGRIRYLTAAAELLPFRADVFDLVTVASGVHWFDQRAFCDEARRVLRAGGAMVVYEHHFLGRMEGVEGFETWMHERYLSLYPIPPRGEHPGPDWEARGFESVGREEYADPVSMSKPQLVDYFLTQSNVVVPVECGEATMDGVARWLVDELDVFFADSDEQTLTFWGIVHAFVAE